MYVLYLYRRGFNSLHLHHMDTNLIAAIAGALIALGGVLLQSLLSYRFSKNQSLIEARRIIYARLLSAAMSEDLHPIFPIAIDVDRDKFNQKLIAWRLNRKNLKSIAVEALFVSNNVELKTKLKKFVENDNPDFRLSNLEELMRKEISL